MSHLRVPGERSKSHGFRKVSIILKGIQRAAFKPSDLVRYLADLEVRAAAVSSSGPKEPRTAVQRSPPDPGNPLFVQMEGDSRRGATSTAATGWGSSPTAIEYELRDSAQANLPQRQGMHPRLCDGSLY